MTREWTLKRNCSLTPRQFGLAYGMLGAAMLLIGLGFALSGFWFVALFAVLDMGAIALALLHYARHATDGEHIALSEGCLLIERTEAGQVNATRLDPCWTKIDLPSRHRTLIRLKSRGIQVEVGGFVSEEKRQQVARELHRELRASSFLV